MKDMSIFTVTMLIFNMMFFMVFCMLYLRKKESCNIKFNYRFSRRLLWLISCKSNDRPKIIWSYFVDYVKALGIFSRFPCKFFAVKDSFKDSAI